MQFLVAVILYFYYQSELSNKKQTLFLEMQNYSLTLTGETFGVDIQKKSQEIQNFVLYEERELFAYFPISGVDDTVLKVSLTSGTFKAIVHKIKNEVMLYALFSTFILALLSFLFSIYTLKPLRQSILFLEEFLKDIIHDLNTPVTAILLNTRLLKKAFKPERLERIEVSAKTIGSLHKNLETFLRETPLDKAEVDIEHLLRERVEYFKSIYHDLDFTLKAKPLLMTSNEDALRRIIDNILSNACKYNKTDGFIKVTLEKNAIWIEDGGIGIKNPDKVFERFYKEGERGLGIGLHIVKKLCDALALDISLVSSARGSRFHIHWSS